uniref:Uncharacterized protein n=1 Tax=Megaselia scalaris TaxID=36166 RepID=T1GDN9_MEGSC
MEVVNFLTCFWILMFLMMTSICLILTLDSYSKWKDSPIIVSLDSQFSSVSDIPFPAITICPYKKFNMEKKNMTDFISRFHTIPNLSSSAPDDE